MTNVIADLLELRNYVKNCRKNAVQLLNPFIGMERDGGLEQLLKPEVLNGMSLLNLLVNDFCAMEQTVFSEEKKEVSLLAFAWLRLYDDFFDRASEAAFIDKFSSFLKEGLTPPTTTKKEEALYEIFMKIKRLIPPVSSFYSYLNAAHEAQCDSHNITSRQNVPLEELVDVNDRKGGYAALCLVSLANPSFPFSRHKDANGRVKAIYDVGVMLQRTDDFTDVCPDLKSGIKTLATENHLSIFDLRNGWKKATEQLEQCYEPELLKSLLSFRIFSSALLPYVIATYYRIRYTVASPR